MKMSYGKAPKKPAKPAGKSFVPPAALPAKPVGNPFGAPPMAGPGMAPPFPLKGTASGPKAKKKPRKM